LLQFGLAAGRARSGATARTVEFQRDTAAAALAQSNELLNGRPEFVEERMNVSHRKKKWEFAWEQMKILEDVGLGRREEFSQKRDKFKLHVDDPKTERLTNTPDAKGGFIRAEEGKLLFRNASSELLTVLPKELVDRSMNSEKGLEFRWTQIHESDIRLLFAAMGYLFGRS
jgi:hypothetical protein